MSARRNKGEAGPEVTLPITPMLDMTFQLLFFFIISFYIYKKDHPTVVIEGQMDLSLPTEAAEIKAQTQDDSDIHAPSHPDASAEDLLKDAIKITVNAEDRGEVLRDIVLEDGKQQANHLAEGVEQTSDAGQFHRALLAKLSNELNNHATGPDALKQSIWIQCDANLQWSVVVQVMDVCRAIGFQKIGFQNPPGAKKK